MGPRAGLKRLGKDQNLLPVPRMEPRYLGSPARRLDTILSELSRIPTIFVLLFKLIKIILILTQDGNIVMPEMLRYAAQRE